MNKQEFLKYLRRKLWRYEKTDADDAVNYYDELISDKIAKENITEEAAVASLGDKKKIVEECVSGMEKKSESGESRGGAAAKGVVVGVLASPILFPLLFVALLAVFLLGVAWFVVIVSFGAAGIGGLVLAVGNWFTSPGAMYGLLLTGAGLVVFALGTGVCIAVAYYGYKGIKNLVLSIIRAIKKKK